MRLVHRVTKAKASTAPLAPLTEDAAAQAMWLFYRDHKLQLVTDIRDYRAGILAQLMAGVAVEDVFAPYFKPAEPASTLRRAA
jgi:hypothetical protein